MFISVHTLLSPKLGQKPVDQRSIISNQQIQLARMIDANLNRAREGLRVIEDCARFSIDDEPLVRACKSIRHQLQSAIQTLDDPMIMIESRDTPNDVGTQVSTTNERDRSNGISDIAQAACKRASEALRVVEECSKALGGRSELFESIRYSIYTIEKELMLKLAPSCPQWTLCVLITQSLCTHFSTDEIVSRSVKGGADCIQIREKDMRDPELIEHATRLTRIAHDLGIHVMINDRVDIAYLSGADRVHLGLDDLPTHEARRLLGPRKWIGRTCPTLDHAISAIQSGADTCGIGPVFPSTTKPRPEQLGLEKISSYLAHPTTSNHPMLAISGINPTNIDQLAQIGCPGVAISSAACGSTDPERVCASIVESIS